MNLSRSNINNIKCILLKIEIVDNTIYTYTYYIYIAHVHTLRNNMHTNQVYLKNESNSKLQSYKNMHSKSRLYMLSNYVFYSKCE